MQSRAQRLALLLGLGVLASVASATAETLTIDAIYGRTSLSGPAPRGVKISPDGKRVAFLRGRPDDQFQLDLWVYDARDRRTRMLVDSKTLVPDESLSDAEKARRERARTAALHGILDYDWSPDGGSLLFPLGEALYLYDLKTPPAAAMRRIAQGPGMLDPKISPRGRYVSFVRDQDLYVVDLTSAEERRLTSDGGGTLHNGEAEFVAQEEMDQRSGYWWAPDDGTIAFKQYDESPVPVVKRFEVYADRTDVIEERYPAAGDSNVIVRLGLVRPQGGDPRWVDLGPDADIYLARVDWAPDGKTLTFQRESRDQKRLDLVAVDATTLAQRQLLTETSPTWINLNDDLRFLRRRPAFLWASERTGHKHLYLYGLDGRMLRQLTQGDWNMDAVLAADERAGVVYVSGCRDTVVDSQIYTVRLDGPPTQEPVRVSRGAGWHRASFAPAAETVSLYVDSYSGPSTPPQTSVRGPDGRWLAWIEENRLDERHPYWPYRDAHVLPEFGTIPAENGEALTYQLFKPPHFDSTRRYPVFVNVYGGPGAHTVRRGWCDLFDEYMAQQGYVVFALDNRGSGRRGRRFEDAPHGRLGDIEARDQLAGIRWLARQPFVDPARIGVFGWSYGGYMTLMLLARGSGALAAGVAVAPVTDWRLYDSHYTERYLGSPRTNAAGYDSSAVFGSLAGITAPLLLVHGMADDNVLFLNSTRLMAALQTQGTRFRLMTYPGGKHSLSTPEMRKHVHHLIADFLDETLKPGGQGQ